MLRSLSRALVQRSCIGLSEISSAFSQQQSVAAALPAAALWPHRPSALAHPFSAAAAESGETIAVTFKDEKDGSETTVQAPVGKSLLEVAHENDVELEGACEGSLACSTCHVIVEDQDLYDKLPEPDDDENDMLDLAFGLTETSRLGCQVKCQQYMDGIVLRIPSATNDAQAASRLGCQIIASKELDGLVVRIPSATRNMAVDGYRPKPH